MVGIGRVLAEPSRVQMLREIAAGKEPKHQSTDAVPQSARNRVWAATLSHHVKQLKTAGLVEIAREGKFVSLVREREARRASVDRLSTIGTAAKTQKSNGASR
jgi:ArsR family transcriptional regulator, arsenate/arsenite/antimonite-responsive transcriptional repressor